MSARGRIVEQFEMSRMARNGVTEYKIELPEQRIIRRKNKEGKNESVKQLKIREVEVMPPEPEEGIERSREIKVLEEAPIKKMENSNRRIIEIHTKVPTKRYYIMIMFGLVTAIIGGVMLFVTKDLIYVLIIISGVGIFLIESIDFKEAKEIEKRFKAVD